MALFSFLVALRARVVMGVLLVVVVMWMMINSYLLHRYDYHGVYFPYSPSSSSSSLSSSLELFPPSDVKYFYQSEYTRVLLDQPALKEMCNNDIVWQKNIYVDCHRNLMGAFNAINRVQVCMRWAMDAGVGLVMPEFWRRVGVVQVDNEAAGRNNINFILNAEFLWKALKKNCPQLQVVKLEDLKNRVEINTKYIISPDNQLQKGDYKTLVNKLITDYKKKNPKKVEEGTPIVIKQWDSLCGWKVNSDPLPFQISFKEIFLFHPSIIQLALNMLYKMPKTFNGLHLRAEADWLALRDSIGGTILDKVEERTLNINNDKENNDNNKKKNNEKNNNNNNKYPVIYVACGDKKELNKFTNMAGERGMQIATKWSLANESEILLLQRLEFDQLALVDYIILHHSQNFYGDGMSSFSFELGVTRHLEQFGNLNYTGVDESQYLVGEIEQMFANNVGLW